MAKSVRAPKRVGGRLQLEPNGLIAHIVFAGPSLLPDSVGVLPPHTQMLPPIQRGDLDQAERAFPNLKSIGIVDGKFFDSFSISPKEILRSMDRGKRVFGSSTIGALRATELSIYGMSGVGKIHRMFASGELDADDEVLMNYDAQTFQRLSEPMVDIRLALMHANENGQLSDRGLEIAIREIRNIHYPERTYPNVLAQMREHLTPEELSQIAAAIEALPKATTCDAYDLLHVMGVVGPLPKREDQNLSAISPLQRNVQDQTANRRHWPKPTYGHSPPMLRKVLPQSGTVPLPQPVAALPTTLSDVLNRRRSVRTYASRNLSLAEISTLLHHSARVIGISCDEEMGDTALRPFPSAGARSELEIYLVSDDISELTPGAYYYDPFGHAILKLRDRDRQHQQILASADVMSGGQLNRPPSAVVLITAVFERIMWKYGDLGPSLIYKDVGCLIQTLYLVATALGLAPCAMGGGDEVQNSRWLGLDPRVESQVGCLLLGPAIEERSTQPSLHPKLDCAPMSL